MIDIIALMTQNFTIELNYLDENVHELCFESADGDHVGYTSLNNDQWSILEQNLRAIYGLLLIERKKTPLKGN